MKEVVGYDSEYTGQLLGRHLSETVVKRDYILLEYGVPGWSSSEAKKIVMETVSANGNKVDAIMAFSDTLAGACAEALDELITMHNVDRVLIDSGHYTKEQVYGTE